MKNELDKLFEALKCGDVDLTDSLPFFGPHPKDTMEVWSWDETRMIVGSCVYDLRIVARS